MNWKTVVFLNTILKMSICLIVFSFLILCLTQTYPAYSKEPVKELVGETWTPPQSPPANLIGPKFIKELEEATDGTVKVKFFAGGALGPPAELYNRILQNVIDFGQFNVGYTPGVFPFTEMFELPLLIKSSESLTKAMIELYKKGYLKNEYKDVHFLFYHNIAPYQLWSKIKISGVNGLRGKKIRCPSPLFVEVTKAIDAIPVSLPASEIFNALQKGIVDATWATGGMALAFKIGEVAKYWVQLNLGTTVQVWAINKNSYEGLPEKGKRYIHSNWESLCLFGSRAMEEYSQRGFIFAKGKSVACVTWGQEELDRLNTLLAPIFKKWVDSMEAKGLPGKKALFELYENLEKQGMKDPFVLPK